MDSGSVSVTDGRNDDSGKRSIGFDQKGAPTDQPVGDPRSVRISQEHSERRVADDSGRSKEVERAGAFKPTSTQNAEDALCVLYDLSSDKEEYAHSDAYTTMNDIRGFTTEEFITWAMAQKIRPLKWDMGDALRAVHFDGKMFANFTNRADYIPMLQFIDQKHLPSFRMVGIWFPELREAVLAQEFAGSSLRDEMKETYDLATTAPRKIKDYFSFSRRELPFFAPKELRPERFQYVDAPGPDSFYYYGREAFLQLAAKGNKMNTTTRRKLYLHGTMGTGKSHIMAAYAVYLVANRRRVVFIPDCRLLAVRPTPTLRNALLLAFADLTGSMILRDIGAIRTASNLKDFCDMIAPRHTIYFLIDQVNALDPSEPTEDRLSVHQKEETRALLDWITVSHIKIQSGSGNYGHGLGDMLRQSSEDLLSFSGGLTTKEMTSWWMSDEDGLYCSKNIGEAGREEIEAVTGRLPMLLNLLRAVEPGDLENFAVTDAEAAAVRAENARKLVQLIEESDTARRMAQMIHKFWVTISARVKDTTEEASYFEGIDCCLTREPVDVSTQGLFDHRFQYIEDDRGQLAGGSTVARGFARLLRQSNNLIFNGVRWYSALSVGMNECVLGFLSEQMSLSWISIHGLAHIAIPPGCNTISFTSDPPPFQKHDNAFAVPLAFNYPNVDAIYWRTLSDKGATRTKLLLVGIQHTLSAWKKHTEAEKPFFARAREWMDALNWDAEFMLVWVVEKRYDGDLLDERVEEEAPGAFAERVGVAKKAQAAEYAKQGEKGGRVRKIAIPTHPTPTFTRHVIEIKEFADRIGRKLANARGETYSPPTVTKDPTLKTRSGAVSRRRGAKRQKTERKSKPSAPSKPPPTGKRRRSDSDGSSSALSSAIQTSSGGENDRDSEFSAQKTQAPTASPPAHAERRSTRGKRGPDDTLVPGLP